MPSRSLLATLILAALLSGCGSQEGQQAGANGSAEAGIDPLNLEAGAAALSAAQLQARATQALAAVLADPASARFSNLRNGAAGAVCGDVDAKVEGRYSGPRPFLVNPEGLALISPTAEIGFGDTADIFPDFYIRWCASPEELQRLGPRLATPVTGNEQMPEVAAPVPAAPAPAPLPAADPPRPAPPRATPPKAAPRPPRQPGDDSFANAVLGRDDEP